MTQPHDKSLTVNTAPDQDAPDATRRRFVVAAIAAAPLLVTLTARPARANGTESGSLGNYASTTP